MPRCLRYVTAWKHILAQAWQRLEEPGPFVAAPPEVIQLTEAITALADTQNPKKRAVLVCTIDVREHSRRGTEQDRWHALWVFDDDKMPACALIQCFRQSEHHE
ncbi:MAG: hypothetical protein JNJ46_16770 [Myxococcales bacterium]|nr:hypothetical protein [Myxococcales bacterium]